jgi:hypothetical protein
MAWPKRGAAGPLPLQAASPPPGAPGGPSFGEVQAAKKRKQGRMPLAGAGTPAWKKIAAMMESAPPGGRSRGGGGIGGL